MLSLSQTTERCPAAAGTFQAHGGPSRPLLVLRLLEVVEIEAGGPASPAHAMVPGRQGGVQVVACPDTRFCVLPQTLLSGPRRFSASVSVPSMSV